MQSKEEIENNRVPKQIAKVTECLENVLKILKGENDGKRIN